MVAAAEYAKAITAADDTLQLVAMVAAVSVLVQWCTTYPELVAHILSLLLDILSLLLELYRGVR